MRWGELCRFWQGTKPEADETKTDAPSLLLVSAVKTVDHGRPSPHGVAVPCNTHDLHSHGVYLQRQKKKSPRVDRQRQ